MFLSRKSNKNHLLTIFFLLYEIEMHIYHNSLTIGKKIIRKKISKLCNAVVVVSILLWYQYTFMLK